MNQLAIQLEFTDQNTAEEVTHSLATPSDRPPEPVRLEVQEAPADSLQAADWAVVSLLLVFGGDIVMGAANKMGELIVEKVVNLARSIRSSSRGKLSTLSASGERRQSLTHTSKTMVTIQLRDHSKSIQITAETTDADISSFAESVREDYEP